MPGSSELALRVRVPEKPLMLIKVTWTAVPLGPIVGVAEETMPITPGPEGTGVAVTMKLRSSISVFSGSTGGRRATTRMAEVPFMFVRRGA